MKTVGLTGGIACGKSSVAEILRSELHLTVIDADQVSRDITSEGSVGLAWIVEAFGAEVLAADGTLDRKALGRIVMQREERRRQLEAITHPLIHEEISSRLNALESAGSAVAVVEAALMVETGNYTLYDHVIVVSASRETQVRRLAERNGFGQDEAARWVDSQMPMELKEAVATVVIQNEGDLAALRRATLDAWRQLDF